MGTIAQDMFGVELLQSANAFDSTNNHVLPALTVAQLYRSRWQVERFFR